MSHSIETHRETIFTAKRKQSHHRRPRDESDIRSKFSTSDHMRAALNQLKFGWNFQYWPSFDRDAHIYFMGRHYSANEDGCTPPSSSGSSDGTLADFADDFATRLWFTYREDFPPLGMGGGDQTSHQPPNATSSVGTPSSTHSEPKCPLAMNDLFVDSDLGLIVDILPCDENHSPRTDTISLERKEKGIRHLVPKFSSAFRKYKPVQHHTAPKPGAKIPLSIQTSDSGWGCMIRSGQMLLAQALMIHLLGRNWRSFKGTNPIQTPEDHVHRQLIRWFYDSWSLESPFSVHRLVQASGQLPGSWFGPATMCSTLVKVMSDASRRFDELARLHIYWARDRVIYREEILALARGQSILHKPGRLNYTAFSANFQGPCSNEPTHLNASTSLSNGTPAEPWSNLPTSHAVILLLPIMLGPDKRINPRYVPMVCRLFRDPCFVGIIGGRPKHSIYMLGCQNTQLIHLDPHFTQPLVRNVVESETFSVKTWHCLVPRVLDAAKLDPSCAVGFYCRSRGELSDLLERLPQLMSVPSVKKNQSLVMESLVEIKDDEDV